MPGLPDQDEDVDLFKGAVDWINTSGPIRWKDLRGKVVVVDFWTYCCINCHHVLPDLEKLEAKYGDGLVVIGIHTAKFDAEKDTENIRKKVREYRIAHPVINDADMTLWNRFGVRSWPTLCIFDVDGKVAWARGGEGHYEEMDQVIGGLVDKARADGKLNTTPLYFGAEKDKPSPGPLLFPGKVIADAEGGRLFISDTGHNRIVVADLAGKVREIIGNGETGQADGAYDRAMFNRQQGMLLVGEILYVADVENHQIRAIDLKAKTVKTVAGTGKQGRLRSGGGEALATAMNSPWDLAPLPGSDAMIVAMAGPHQLWKFDPKAGTLEHWAGSGLENSTDGNLEKSAFAQPSGLATDGKTIYVADSEASAIRAVDAAAGKVGTAAGTHDLPNGQSLFAFGDRDGSGPNARLQHCLGVSFDVGKLYVADSYNNKIKVYDPESGSIRTLAGDGQYGDRDGRLAEARFDQPGGLGTGKGILYIADTNNHRIRTIDLESGAVGTLAIEGLKAPTPARKGLRFPNAKAVPGDPIRVRPGSDRLRIAVSLAIPEGFKLNEEAPMPYQVEGQSVVDSPVVGKLTPPTSQFVVEVPLSKAVALGDSIDLKISLSILLCKEGSNGYCEIRSLPARSPSASNEGPRRRAS
ncbi:MAG: thioredoxin-like domain-containing protein [Isosphaeraceae bacterium]